MKKTVLSIILSSIAIFSFISCGSKPKREMKITLVYSNATEMLESANASILSGDYEKAEYFLNLAYNQSMTIDNYDLLTSVCLAYVSLNLSHNPPLTEQAEKYLSKALQFAKFSTVPEKQEALCTLNEVRINLSNTSVTPNYVELISKLEKKEKAIKNDKYAEAQFASAYGDIYRVCSNYTEAESSYEKAVKLYTDNCYLSEIGITWYKIAQVRSLNNKKSSALSALENAIFYDRAAENTLALGTDYYIKGLILLKGNPTSQETEDAKIAFQHSADIFTAAGNGMEELAARSLKAKAASEL